jgi:hypothetical protein
MLGVTTFMVTFNEVCIICIICITCNGCITCVSCIAMVSKLKIRQDDCAPVSWPGLDRGECDFDADGEAGAE